MAALALLNGLFHCLLRASTAAGRRVMDRIEGLQMYLRTAETPRLNLAGAPEISAERFERLLPYAIGLDAEAPWSDAFERAFARTPRRGPASAAVSAARSAAASLRRGRRSSARCRRRLRRRPVWRRWQIRRQRVVRVPATRSFTGPTIWRRCWIVACPTCADFF